MLIDYITVMPTVEDGHDRGHKYPFIAGEIFNCEINQILDKFFEPPMRALPTPPPEEEKEKSDGEKKEDDEEKDPQDENNDEDGSPQWTKQLENEQKEKSTDADEPEENGNGNGVVEDVEEPKESDAPIRPDTPAMNEEVETEKKE